MTRDEAIALAESKWWVGKTAAEIFCFQINEQKLCMNFGDFHKATESALGRPVFTHEFANPLRLMQEFSTNKRATLTDILAELPADKTIVVVTP